MPIIPLSNLSYSSKAGVFLRWWLKWIPPKMIIPVLQGPLRGTKWIVGAQTHGMWLGSYEYRMQNALAKLVKPGQVFYDIGANVGFYSLLAAKLVGNRGLVYSFEPLPRNIEFLDRHIKINGFTNISIINKAVAGYSGDGYFSANESSMGHIANNGSIRIDVITLDDFINNIRANPPDLIKVDIEGSEVDMMRGAILTLKKYRPALFMAIHSQLLLDQMHQLCNSYGYSIQNFDGVKLSPGEYISEVRLIPQ